MSAWRVSHDAAGTVAVGGATGCATGVEAPAQPIRNRSVTQRRLVMRRSIGGARTFDGGRRCRETWRREGGRLSQEPSIKGRPLLMIGLPARNAGRAWYEPIASLRSDQATTAGRPWIDMPPSTDRHWPVMYDAAGIARKATAVATS